MNKPIVIDAGSRLMRWLAFASRTKDVTDLNIRSMCQLISSVVRHTFFAVSSLALAAFVGVANGTVWWSLFQRWMENPETWLNSNLDSPDRPIHLAFLITFGVTTMIVGFIAAGAVAMAVLTAAAAFLYFSYVLLQKLIQMGNERLEAKYGPGNKYVRLRQWMEALGGLICRPVSIQRVTK